jgi:hypothetical protein
MQGTRPFRSSRLVWLMAALGAASPAQPRLQVLSPTAIALAPTCAAGGVCQLGSASIIAAAAGDTRTLTLSVRSFRADGEIQKVEVTPAAIQVEADRATAVKLEFSAAISKLPVRGHLIVAGGGDIAAVPFHINAPPAASSGEKKARLQRVQDTLVKSLVAAFVIVFLTGIALGIHKRTHRFLFEEIGLASWNKSSWASNTGAVSGLATSVLAIPGAVEITKYPWALDFGLLGVFAALLTAFGPLIFNLTSHYTQGKDPVQVNWVAVFFVSTIASIAGVATSWQTLWYANEDLVSNGVLNPGVGLGVQGALYLLLVVFAIYFFYNIFRIVPAQTEAVERQVKGLAAGITLTGRIQPRWTVL